MFFTSVFFKSVNQLLPVITQALMLLLTPPVYSLDVRVLVLAIREGDITRFNEVIRQALREEGVPQRTIRYINRYSPYQLGTPPFQLPGINNIVSRDLSGPWGHRTQSSLLQLAARYASAPFVRILINSGANVNHLPRGSLDVSGLRLPPSAMAVFGGRLENLQLLVESGADYRYQLSRVWNLMHIAIECNYMHIVEYLLTLSPEMVHEKSLCLTSFFSTNGLPSPLHFCVQIDLVSAIVLFINFRVDLSLARNGNLLALAEQHNAVNVFNILGAAITASSSIDSTDYPELSGRVFSLQTWAILAIAKNYKLGQLDGKLPLTLGFFILGKRKPD